MANVLILYPKLFRCYPKFARKVEKLVSGLGEVTLIYPNDPNLFIEKLRDDSAGAIQCNQVTDWKINDVTHAIVFDDGEEFSDATTTLQAAGLPLRVVKIAITRVINIKVETDYKSEKSTADYEYIGRGSYWGNPHSMYEEGDDREEVIRKYKYDFDYEKFPNKEKSEVYKLTGKRLGCFCKPQACHGDVLADFLNEWDDGK
jgi:hypothetical protein